MPSGRPAQHPGPGTAEGPGAGPVSHVICALDPSPPHSLLCGGGRGRRQARRGAAHKAAGAPERHGSAAAPGQAANVCISAAPGVPDLSPPPTGLGRPGPASSPPRAGASPGRGEAPNAGGGTRGERTRARCGGLVHMRAGRSTGPSPAGEAAKCGVRRAGVRTCEPRRTAGARDKHASERAKLCLRAHAHWRASISRFNENLQMCGLNVLELIGKIVLIFTPTSAALRTPSSWLPRLPQPLPLHFKPSKKVVAASALCQRRWQRAPAGASAARLGGLISRLPRFAMDLHFRSKPA